MIVVGVRPAGRVDLSGRNAHRAQGRHGKGRLLAAASDSRFQAGERRECAGIAGLIGDVLVAPVVHLEDGVLHGHVADTLLQFFIEHLSCLVECLVVHSCGQHEVSEQQLRHLLSPRHLASSLEGCAHVGSMEGSWIVGDVGDGHIGIEEAQRLLLLTVECQTVGVEELRPNELHLLFECLLYLCAVVGIADEMCGCSLCPSAQATECQQSDKDGVSFHCSGVCK